MRDTTPGHASTISQHYRADGLADQILASLRADGKDVDALCLDDLAPVDQLHAGGAQATAALMSRAGLREGMHVLDVGGGLGGPARQIAQAMNCVVTVLDLSEALCRSGAILTERTGLADRVRFRHGDALAMPFPDGAFDRVWTQHATMNVADKERLYGEISRVLRPGGWLVMQEMMAGSVQPIHFPVPWARDASISYLATPAEVRALLSALGFREIEWVDEGASALANVPTPLEGTTQQTGPALAARLMFGPQLREMVRNVGRNLEEGRLTSIRAVFERP